MAQGPKLLRYAADIFFAELGVGVIVPDSFSSPAVDLLRHDLRADERIMYVGLTGYQPRPDLKRFNLSTYVVIKARFEFDEVPSILPMSQRRKP